VVHDLTSQNCSTSEPGFRQGLCSLAPLGLLAWHGSRGCWETTCSFPFFLAICFLNLRLEPFICLKRELKRFVFVFCFFLQEPSWSSSLLGLACAWTAHQDNRTTWKNRRCVQEAIEKLLSVDLDGFVTGLFGSKISLQHGALRNSCWLHNRVSEIAIMNMGVPFVMQSGL
jgi:hypothetical protein